MAPGTQMPEETSILINGCGPTGALLSVLLTKLQIPFICLDKSPSIATDPRGIALDEDGIRALQAAGIYESIFSEIGSCAGTFGFISGSHHDLFRKPFLQMDLDSTEGGTGHPAIVFHKQPVMEAKLRERIAGGALRTGCTLIGIDEDEKGVNAKYVDSQGNEKVVRSKFLVGADGKTGFVRKNYLEPKGLVMDPISIKGGDYAETWVAMNLKVTLPTPESHPDFPLWRQGYSSDQVNDVFFPKGFRFLCNPQRPSVCGRFGLQEDRLWRFEYVVQPGEDGTEMASQENIRKIVYPYLRRPGHRYGLTEDIEFPEDCIQVLRSRPFFFSARSCNRWSEGRVILCGDSAHVFPPFGGQGIASGFRDAMSLAWRLQVAVERYSDSYQSLFEGWYLERQQQLVRSLATTVANGRYATEGNALRVFFRDTALGLMQMIPSWKRWLEKGPRAEGIYRYKYQRGLHFSKKFRGGGLFPQVYCTKRDSSSIQFTDDVIFSPGKTGLMQLVIVVGSRDEIDWRSKDLRALSTVSLSSGRVRIEESTFIIEDQNADMTRKYDRAGTVVRIATGDEFASSPLCNGRPEPGYYDGKQISRETRGKPFLLVRPDRFIFAACAGVQELKEALQMIEPILKGKGQSRSLRSQL